MVRRGQVGWILAVTFTRVTHAFCTDDNAFLRAVQHCIDDPYPDRERTGADYTLALLFTNQQVDHVNKLIVARHRDHPVAQGLVILADELNEQ